MMKMMSRTYARSSIGVTLISSYASFSSPTGPDMCLSSSGVSLGDARHELVHEDAHVRHDLFHTGVEIVVAEETRDGDAEAGDRGHQRRGGAGRDGIDVDIARGRDCGKGDHDPY